MQKHLQVYVTPLLLDVDDILPAEDLLVIESGYSSVTLNSTRHRMLTDQQSWSSSTVAVIEHGSMSMHRHIVISSAYMAKSEWRTRALMCR